MKFSLTKEEKIKLYNDVRIELYKNLLVRLNILGIDPDTFDEDLFIPNENSSSQTAVQNLVEKIKEIDKKMKQVENE